METKFFALIFALFISGFSTAVTPSDLAVAAIYQKVNPPSTQKYYEVIGRISTINKKRVVCKTYEEADKEVDKNKALLTSNETLLNFILNNFSAGEYDILKISIDSENSKIKDEIAYYKSESNRLLRESQRREYPHATKVWIFLTETLGYNKYVAAGIVGNMMAECGGQTLDLQWNIYSASGNFYGLCQWYNKYYPTAAGSSLEAQLDLLVDTIEGEFKTFGKIANYSYEKFLLINNEKTAAVVFAKVYERCGPRSHLVRQKNATKALEYFKR